MISRRNQKHLIAHGLMPRMIPLSRGLHFGGGAVRCLADHLAASPPPPPGAATDRGVDTLLLSVLPTADTDSGESASSEYSVARADSWSWSPDTGWAGDTLGDTISRELPTCSSSDRDRGTVSRLGPRLARAGCSHELMISLCLGWADSGTGRPSWESGTEGRWCGRGHGGRRLRPRWRISPPERVQRGRQRGQHHHDLAQRPLCQDAAPVLSPHQQ